MNEITWSHQKYMDGHALYWLEEENVEEGRFWELWTYQAEDWVIHIHGWGADGEDMEEYDLPPHWVIL